MLNWLTAGRLSLKEEEELENLETSQAKFAIQIQAMRLQTLHRLLNHASTMESAQTWSVLCEEFWWSGSRPRLHLATWHWMSPISTLRMKIHWGIARHLLPQILPLIFLFSSFSAFNAFQVSLFCGISCHSTWWKMSIIRQAYRSSRLERLDRNHFGAWFPDQTTFLGGDWDTMVVARHGHCPF